MLMTGMPPVTAYPGPGRSGQDQACVCTGGMSGCTAGWRSDQSRTAGLASGRARDRRDPFPALLAPSHVAARTASWKHNMCQHGFACYPSRLHAGAAGMHHWQRASGVGGGVGGGRRRAARSGKPGSTFRPEAGPPRVHAPHCYVSNGRPERDGRSGLLGVCSGCRNIIEIPAFGPA